MSQILTNALAKYKAIQEATGNPIILDEIVFAFIPGLDPNEPIDPDETLPPDDQIQYRYDIPSNNIGYLNEDSVVYSCVLGTDIGTWDYNAIYLVNKTLGLAGAIIHEPTQTKTKANPVGGVEGDTLSRNIVTTYSNAQELTQINITAETWQLDFNARLTAMDELARQNEITDKGFAAFYRDGWKVTHTAAATSATISPGVGYVGGLISTLDSEYTLDLTDVTFPKTAYLIASFQGQANSAWAVINEIRVEDTLEPVFTENGITYYATPLANLSSSSPTEDLRTPSRWEQHLNASDPHPQYVNTTEDQSINGIKTFEKAPKIVEESTEDDAVVAYSQLGLAKSTVTSHSDYWTKIATLNGSDLALIAEATFVGTTNGIVISSIAKFNVGHNDDIKVTLESGGFTALDIKVISDGNTSFDLYIKHHNGGSDTVDELNCEVRLLSKGSVSFDDSENHSSQTLQVLGHPFREVTKSIGSSIASIDVPQIYENGIPLQQVTMNHLTSVFEIGCVLTGPTNPNDRGLGGFWLQLLADTSLRSCDPGYMYENQIFGDNEIQPLIPITPISASFTGVAMGTHAHPHNGRGKDGDTFNGQPDNQGRGAAVNSTTSAVSAGTPDGTVSISDIGTGDTLLNVRSQSHYVVMWVRVEESVFKAVKGKRLDKVTLPRFYDKYGNQHFVMKPDAPIPAWGVEKKPPKYNRDTHVVLYKDDKWKVLEIREGQTYWNNKAEKLPIASKWFELPDNHTFEQPPEDKEGYFTRWIDGEWKYVEDNMNKFMWLKSDCTAQSIQMHEEGSIPDDYTLLEPPTKRFDVWNIDHWQIDREQTEIYIKELAMKQLEEEATRVLSRAFMLGENVNEVQQNFLKNRDELIKNFESVIRNELLKL